MPPNSPLVLSLTAQHAKLQLKPHGVLASLVAGLDELLAPFGSRDLFYACARSLRYALRYRWLQSPSPCKHQQRVRCAPECHARALRVLFRRQRRDAQLSLPESDNRSASKFHPHTRAAPTVPKGRATQR